MSRNEELNGHTSPLILAGLVCLLSMPLIFAATRPVIWLFSAPWVPWCQAAIFTLAPFTIAFMVLYWCAWHNGQPPVRRILATIVSSCAIVAVDLLLIGALGIVGGLIAGMSRKMGGN